MVKKTSAWSVIRQSGAICTELCFATYSREAGDARKAVCGSMCGELSARKAVCAEELSVRRLQCSLIKVLSRSGSVHTPPFGDKDSTHVGFTVSRHSSALSCRQMLTDTQ